MRSNNFVSRKFMKIGVKSIASVLEIILSAIRSYIMCNYCIGFLAHCNRLKYRCMQSCVHFLEISHFSANANLSACGNQM